MKKVFCFLLLCSILGQASMRTLLVLHYQWNKAVYLQNCENRDKPDLKCDGKCALRKKMTVDTAQNQTKGSPQLPDQFRQIKDLQLFIECNEAFQLHASLEESLATLPPYLVWGTNAPKRTIFRPPISIC
ncbi:MAG: hypothetical protein NW218_12020 [Saprospiraceae bacterium]|nr:hypothetical protein [Saprospiraceae bacterium]